MTRGSKTTANWLPLSHEREREIEPDGLGSKRKKIPYYFLLREFPSNGHLFPGTQIDLSKWTFGFLHHITKAEVRGIIGSNNDGEYHTGLRNFILNDQKIFIKNGQLLTRTLVTCKDNVKIRRW